MTVELFVAMAVAAALVLVILVTSGPRPRRAREQRAREYTTSQALDRFGDDADHLFR